MLRCIVECVSCTIAYPWDGRGEEMEIVQSEETHRGYGFMYKGRLVTKSNHADFPEDIKVNKVLSRDHVVHQLLFDKECVGTYDFSEACLNVDRIKFSHGYCGPDMRVILGKVDVIPYDFISKMCYVEFDIELPDDKDFAEEIVARLKENHDEVKVTQRGDLVHFKCRPE